MKKSRYLIALVALSAATVPAFAQSTSPSSSGVQPADTPRTNLEKQQTEQNGQATKYGQSDTGSTQPSATDHKAKHTGTSSTSETPKKTGDPAGMPSTPTQNNSRPSTAN